MKLLYRGLIYESFDGKNPIHGGIGDNIHPVSKKELAMGIKVEQEHIKNNKTLNQKQKDEVAEDIARDHLSEFPLPDGEGYYTELAKMEKILEKRLKEYKKSSK